RLDMSSPNTNPLPFQPPQDPPRHGSPDGSARGGQEDGDDDAQNPPRQPRNPFDQYGWVPAPIPSGAPVTPVIHRMLSRMPAPGTSAAPTFDGHNVQQFLDNLE
ncbi:hypothetical protein H0H93_002759, partial [Arthromyces matolae]